MDIKECIERLGLKESDLKRLDVKGIKELIKANKQQLKVWSVSGYNKKEIEEENKYLKILLEYAKKTK